jgi:hypothetical protein
LSAYTIRSLLCGKLNRISFNWMRG